MPGYERQSSSPAGNKKMVAKNLQDRKEKADPTHAGPAKNPTMNKKKTYANSFSAIA